MKNDDFWDYDRQTDLEGFRSQVVYDTLAKQSKGVTQAIGQHKDNVKLMYQRIADQTESLKGINFYSNNFSYLISTFLISLST